MSREVDRRDFAVNKVTQQRQDALNARASEVSDALPGDHRIRIASFDPTKGNPLLVTSESAPAESGNHFQRALDHVRSIGRALGLAETQQPEFDADPDVQVASAGTVTVHLQQLYQDIPVFQATQAVRFSSDGALKETMGSTATFPDGHSASPTLPVEQAVLRAARHVTAPDPDEEGASDPFGEPMEPAGVDVTGFDPQIMVTLGGARQTTDFAPGPFGEKIRAGLIWFDIDDAPRLTWEVLLTLPGYQGQYRTLVDAADGEILYCHQLMQSVVARGTVFRVDGQGTPQMTDFPRPLADHGLPIPANLPQGFPDDWVTGDRTEGNNSFAHLGDTGPSLPGQSQGGVMTFAPSDPTGDDQKVLNIFYYNAFMHDFFYLLGFQEADGSFQRENFGRGGAASDRVDARAHSGAVWGTANMFTPVDGVNPVMNMGLVTSTGRHTAFDSGVVFHEFMHGVTNRLVGGPMNVQALDAPQSGGMGEGWGDYIACSINQTAVVGDWVVNNPGGIRGFPYDSSFPDNFGDLGTGRYSEVHNIGEIWCATLMEMNRNIGTNPGLQLVVDALKLSPATPGFLDMRDSILAALDGQLAAGQITTAEHSTRQNGIWEAFAKFGMGPNAQSNGASLSGIAADFSTPAPTTPPQPPQPPTPPKKGCLLPLVPAILQLTAYAIVGPLTGHPRRR